MRPPFRQHKPPLSPLVVGLSLPLTPFGDGFPVVQVLASRNRVTGITPDLAQVIGAVLSMCQPDIALAWLQIWNRRQLSRSASTSVIIGLRTRSQPASVMTFNASTLTARVASWSGEQQLSNGGGVISKL